MPLPFGYCSGGVDGGVAAADDCNLLSREVQVPLEDNPFQEVQPVIVSFPVVGAMAEDKSGNIWICTEGGGLDLYQPEQGTFKHFNAHTGYHFSTDYLKDVVFDEANNCLWIAADFTNKVNCFHLDNYRNDIYDLEPLGEESVGEALFALADTPRKLFLLS